MMTSLFVALWIGASLVKADYPSEFKLLEGHRQRESYSSPLPYTYLAPEDLPERFSWANVNGTSWISRSLNQHIPQYCGSCWAHGALSALADRLKIARKGRGDEFGLSIQYILNCAGGSAGSCHGGSHTGTYEYIHQNGWVPYETCQPYVACSSDSTDGFCGAIDTSCSPLNTCRTCDHSGNCYAVEIFPNASIAEYGTYSYFTGGFSAVADKIKAEIYARGPVAAGVNAEPLIDYQGQVVYDSKFWNMMVNHVVSIVGWDVDATTGEQYWIVRNSWGQYWGNMGFFNIVMGKNALGIESEIAWATPGSFTIKNFPCNEDASNCHLHGGGGMEAHVYQDPSRDPDYIRSKRHLQK